MTGNRKGRAVLRFWVAVTGLAVAVAGLRAQAADDAFHPSIPRTWDDDAVASLEVPLAVADASPVHVPSKYYYAIPVTPIYKSYTIYAPGRQPPGYIEWLKRQEPIHVWGVTRLKTEADWIAAGETVFATPILYDADAARDVGDPVWYEKTAPLIAKDGTLPFTQYVIREKGKLEVGALSCASCHTRVMPDGTVVKGAQGNILDGRAFAFETRSGRAGNVEDIRFFFRLLFSAPWLKPDTVEPVEKMSLEEIALSAEAAPRGVNNRHGTHPLFPVKVPDLIGIRDRRYLDATGLVRHRDIGDLMRYAALNQGADFLASYGSYIPGGKLPEDPAKAGLGRYSDEQLYALALYVYSLKPPANPHKYEAAAARGEKIFRRAGCATCHTPPLYTNNKLTPAAGFRVPEEHKKKFDILPVVVGTDPNLALRTRRGTGYYKVPSLKGVWYRGPFEHIGSVATLEDWFDPKRLRDDYVPTGFVGYGVKTRAVRGHEFGLRLSAEEKQALIAFLKTL